MPGNKYANQTPKSAKVAKHVITTYPDCWKSFIAGTSYPEIANRLVVASNEQKSNFLSNYALSTIAQSLNGAYFGFNEGVIKIHGIFDNANKDNDEMISLRLEQQNLENRLHVVTGYEKWTDEQTKQLIEIYDSGKSPTQISRELKIEGKTKTGIITKIEDLQKRKILPLSNIKWEGDLANRAMHLILPYAAVGASVPNTQIAVQLNQEFYKGETVIKSQQVNNFRRRLEK